MRTTLVIVGFLALAHPTLADPSTDHPPKAPLGCLIQAESRIEAGRIPNVTVSLTNETDADIYLVGSLDGSDVKMRYPYCYFKVTGPDGNPVHHRTFRCGNKNTLREDDFVRVPPGGAFTPYGRGFFGSSQLIPLNFQTPGRYRLQFVYSTVCDTIAEWAGDNRDDVIENRRLGELFQRVPKVEVVSNEVVVDVVGRGER